MRFPLLDIRHFRTDPKRFAEELRHACHHIGFFQVRTDVPPALVRQTQELSRRFFALPEEAKRSIDYVNSAQFRGYMANGVENTAGKPDLREQIEVAPERPTAAANAMPPYRRLTGRNQWPHDALPELQPAVEQYAAYMGSLADELTEALSLALGLERTALQRFFEPEPHWQLKLASYTPAGAASAAAAAASAQAAAAASAQAGVTGASGSAPAVRADDAPAIGVGAHTDSGFLTLLLQDDSGGLQAYAQGAWRDVPPMGEEVVVCNLGEVAQLLSGGYLLATPHRVLLPPSARLSIPYFHNPCIDAVVEPLSGVADALPWERDARYDAERHWTRPNNAMLAAYGLNAFKSLARSHPAVFARHHPDLQVTADGQVEVVRE